MKHQRQAAHAALAVLCLFCISCAAVGAETFHFTVTADPRDNHTEFGDTLQAINTYVGDYGAFHASPGDVDQSIPDNRAVIDTYFGADALWYPGVGNHEKETAADMTWLRNEYNNGNGIRTPLKNFTNQDGPAGTVETNYSWDYGGAHFVQLNEYWNGAGNDAGTNGDVVPALREWLAADLLANRGKAIIVFGHELAFPYNRHIGDSLDANVTNRNAFWQLLEDEDVIAYMCGHTHYYSTHQGNSSHVGDVWQIDVGAAGNGTSETFVDVQVTAEQVTFTTYNNSGGWHEVESWTERIRVVPGDTDRDEDVDATDLAQIAVHWSPSGGLNLDWSDGDFDGDGDVDATDLAALGLHWNPSGSAVPEPGALSLMACGALAALRRRRRAGRK